MHIDSKKNSLFKIYFFVHHSLEKPCLQRLVNFSYHGLQLLPTSKASIDSTSDILSKLGSIGESLSSLEPILDCGVNAKVMSSKNITTYP